MNSEDILAAADTSNIQAGGKSWADSATDALTYGAGAAVASGVASVYNTGVAAANYFGADADKIDVAKSLNDVDQNWGNYYAQHKDVIDTVGFVATSFVPGGLAVKGLNLARRGEAFGAFGKALNYTASNQTAALERALQVVASPEGSVFTRLNKNFLSTVGWGVADNALQTLTFETAVAATMSQSPLLEGQSFKDMSYDIVKTSLVGGAFGGAIEGFFANKIIKQAVGAVDSAGKKYSSILPEAMERIQASEADKAYSYMDAVLNLPKAVFDGDKALAFTYHLNGRTNSVNLNTASLYDKELTKSIQTGYLEFERHVTTGLTTDPTVGKVMAGALIDLVKEGKVAGLADDAIRARMGDYLFNLKSVEGIGARAGDLADDSVRYFNKGAGGPDNLVSGFTDLFRKDVQPDLYRVRIAGDIGDLKMSMIGKDHLLVSDAFKDGMDIAYKTDGTWTINPKSKLIRPAPATGDLQTFFNTVTKQTSDKAALTVADIATTDAPLLLKGDKVISGDRTFNFSTATPLSADADTVETTARHLWANSLQKIDGTVDASDFSLLDKMSKSKNIVDGETMIGTIPPTNWKNLGNFDNWVFQNKVDYLRNKFADNPAGSLDIQQLALEVNATPDWVQNVIASKFDTNLKKLASGAPDLSDGWSRELGSYSQRENVLLNYKRTPGVITDDFGNLVEVSPKTPFQDNYGGQYLADQTQPFITGQMAYHYRTKLATEHLDTAVASVLGADASKFSAFNAEGLSQMANREGAGAGLLSFANAGYGDGLKLMAQETGKQVHLLANSYADAVLGRLQPLLAAIKNDQAASTELVAAVTKLRRSPEKFAMLGTEHGLDGTYIVDKSLLKGSDAETIAAIREAAQSGSTDSKAFLINNQLTADFLRTHMEINGDTVSKRQVLLNAQGITSNIDPGTLYVPPIDTRKVPFFAFVRPHEGRIFGDSSVSMVTARNAEELLQLTSQIDQNQFQVIFKKDTEKFFKAKGDYDYSRALNDSSVNSGLKRDGKLGDFMPSFKPEDVIEDFIQYHQRQQTQLVRDAVSTKYAQPFAELRRLSEQYTSAATSKLEPIGKFFQRSVQDPYDDYIKTALDISKRSEFTLLHQTNEFIDAVGTRAYSELNKLRVDATEGKVSWEEANQAMVRYGMPGPYADAHSFNLAQTAGDRNLIKTAIQKANMFLSTFTLRLDFANGLLNTISTPIMLGTELSAIKRSIAGQGDLPGILSELTTLKLPGQNAAIPSTTKLIFNSVRNYFGEEGKLLLKRYTDNGDIGSVLSMHHQMMGDLAIPNKLIASDFSNKVTDVTEKAAKYFGGNFAEEFTRFVSADVMRQVTEPIVKAGKMGVQEQNAFISVFVNRVQGNYISSQRPILFQGTLGSAVGLFQTYQFNLLQQLFRHIENRDLRTAAVMGGLQTSVFGLNGLPMFEAINTNIIGNANMNPGHKDIYSTVTQAAGKDIGDWLLYGTASAFPFFSGSAPSLYTRGDINPRHPTIIPVSPMDVPAVDGSIRFVTNLIDTGKKLIAGGDVGGTLLEGLEHNSISRPLAGIAQVMNGASTTGKGSLIAANNDLFSIASASRIAGAKPMDESVGLNTKFRVAAYQAADKERVNILGETVKTKLRSGVAPTEQEYIDFAGKYAKAGGQIGGFSAAMQGWAKDANTSVLNQLTDHARSSYGQRFAEVMGGVRLDNGTPPRTDSAPQTPLSDGEQ